MSEEIQGGSTGNWINYFPNLTTMIDLLFLVLFVICFIFLPQLCKYQLKEKFNYMNTFFNQFKNTEQQNKKKETNQKYNGDNYNTKTQNCNDVNKKQGDQREFILQQIESGIQAQLKYVLTKIEQQQENQYRLILNEGLNNQKNFNNSYQQELTDLKNQQNQQIQQIQEIVDQNESLKLQLTSFKNESYQYQKEINSLTEQLNNNQKKTEEIMKEFENLKKDKIGSIEIDSFYLRTQVNNLNGDLEKLQNEFQDLNKIKPLVSSVDEFKNQLQSQIKQLVQSTDDIKNQLSQLQIQVKKIEDIRGPKPENETIIQTLYNKTCRSRYVEPQYKAFVGRALNKSDLNEEYGLNNLECKTKLGQHLGGMRRVRGDGNCFYTSFVFQYLHYMLMQTSDQQFFDFVELIKTLPFKVSYQEEQFQETDFQNLKSKFIQMIKKLRSVQNDRINLFFEYFQDESNEFYGLSIIFLRNLAYKFTSEDEEIKGLFQAQGLNLENQLLEWEFDCQSVEGVIKLLSEKLNIQTIYFQCYPREKLINIVEYNKIPNPMLKIYLLFRPGHYNIGVPKNA